jgi:hypothetical protein
MDAWMDAYLACLNKTRHVLNTFFSYLGFLNTELRKKHRFKRVLNKVLRFYGLFPLFKTFKTKAWHA